MWALVVAVLVKKKTRQSEKGDISTNSRTATQKVGVHRMCAPKSTHGNGMNYEDEKNEWDVRSRKKYPDEPTRICGQTWPSDRIA